jgi:O-antigen/teichoic acid export membrane protein
MLGAIACLRYEMAIVLPKKYEDAVQVFSLCCIALVAMTLFAAALTILYGNRALLYLNAVDLAPILWLFPIYVFLEGSHLPLRFWYTRQKQFKITALGSILSSLPISIAEITGGLARFRAGEDLVVIRIFGLIFAPAFFVWQLIRGDAGLIIRNISSGGIIKSAKRYSKFPVFDTWSVILTQLSMNAPIFLLTFFFSPEICGLYAKALYLLQLPSLVIGGSVGQVFLQESAAAKTKRKNLAGLVEAVLNRMITIGILPFAILAIISPELFGLFLGARWTESGVYTQILLPQLFIVFLSGSIVTLFGTLGKQELNLISSAVNFMMRLATLTFGGLILRDVRLTLFIFMVVNALIDLWRLSLLIRATKLSVMSPLTHFLRCITYVIPSIVPLATMKWLFGLEAIYLVALAPIFSIPYIALVLNHDLELRNLFSKYLQRFRSLL